VDSSRTNLIEQLAVAESIEGDPEETTEVVLISMPFGPLFWPSIGLSLLKAALAPLGISSKVLYFTFRFAELVGVSLYTQIADARRQPPITDLVGEWIFNGALFDPASLDVEGYIKDVLRGHSRVHKKSASETFIQDVLDMRNKVKSFLDDCVQEVISHRPRIVGFTSVFQQHVASLSLARRIKTQLPEAFIVFGGSSCEGIMGVETVRQFPFVDAVISGEGDVVFPELVQRVLEGRSFSDLEGVYTRDRIDSICVNGRYPNAPLVRDMDALPFPDYEDFFQQFEASRLNKHAPARILFESSRGCWWGERKHCTFCGLNGANLAYRSKSATRALDELEYLASKYPGCGISAVDNILDMNYFKDLIPELAARQLDLKLFYEVKANLRKEQVRLLRDAGIRRIQPGIESLSDKVLRLMHKGVKALQNIQLLKWCKELGVQPAWNMLWGFPGESPEEYARVTDLVPLLTHLPPPQAATVIHLDRFSPNFDYAEQFGFADVAPYPAYFYVYPFDSEAVANLAYYFTFRYSKAQDVKSYTWRLAKAVKTWQAVYETSDLFSVDKGTHLLIWDLRPVASEPLTILTDLQRILYITCDRACTVRYLQQSAEEHMGGKFTHHDIEVLLQPIVERGLMIREGRSYLSLAIPLGDYSPRKPVLERFHEVVKALGEPSGDETVISLVKDAKREVMFMG